MTDVQKGLSLGFLKRSEKGDLTVTAEGKPEGHARVAQEGQDSTETTPTEKAEVAGLSKPSMWW